MINENKKLQTTHGSEQNEAENQIKVSFSSNA